MTDLKTANEQLAQALKALESPEHDADVREAEACRNRLMELDERIGARIAAKVQAHKSIADCWRDVGEYEALMPIDSLQTATSALDRLYTNMRADELKMAAKVYAQPERAFTIEELKSINPSCEPLTADAWEKHHEEHTGKYALAGEQVPDRVMVNGVAEMQQAVQTDEH